MENLTEYIGYVRLQEFKNNKNASKKKQRKFLLFMAKQT